jgi:DNA-binding transcriptional ArsR family regulator
MPPIELDRLRFSRATVQTGKVKPPRHQSGERFLKGPIPLLWLEEAARLPGKSLHAGIALWYAAGLTKSASVPLSNIAGLHFGLDRNAKYRALKWLEGAGLVRVERKLGRAPIVTILAHEARPHEARPHEVRRD